MAMTLTYDIPIAWIILLIVGLGVLVAILEFFRKIALDNESISDSEGMNKNIECSSPGCIRCKTAKNILERGQQRLAILPKSNIAEESDIHTALAKDLNMSLVSISVNNYVSQDLNSRSQTSSPKVLFIKGLRENIVFEASEFSGLSQLVGEYEQIKLEFNHLYQSPLPETKALWKTNSTDNGRWEIVHLVDQGSYTKASELCPLTMKALGSLNCLMDKNVFGNVAFSVIHPQTSIERHCGSSNCRIRCHLGLQIPPKVCSLHVSDTSLSWTRGDVLCFNDAFPHSVTHAGEESSGYRVVFMVDLWHPDISPYQRKLIDYAFSSSS